VLAVIRDRKKVDIKAFFESIPHELKKTVKQVCSDMHDGYVYTAIEVFGPQAVIIDRYHIAKLYRESLDKLRISEMTRLNKTLSSEDYALLEGMMWILRKKHEYLSEADKDKLSLLYKYSPLLKKTHKFALKLTQIFNTHSTRSSAMSKINRWIAHVEKSGLVCFKTFIKTLTKYKPYIGNYFKPSKNSGFVEGLNNKIKVMKRRCYGLLSTETIFQRFF
jgi:transposase